jgi:hypothetical protein
VATAADIAAVAEKSEIATRCRSPRQGRRDFARMHRSGNAVQISPSDDLRPPPGLSGGSRRRPAACRRDAIKGSSFWFLAVPLAFKKGADEKSPGLSVPKHKTDYPHRHFIAFPTALFA